MAKKIIAIILCLGLFSSTAFARASAYINAYNCPAAVASDNSLRLIYQPSVTACSTSDIIKITGSVYELNSGIWCRVDTFQDIVYNRASDTCGGSYIGKSGYSYKVVAVFYVEKNGGSDTKSETSNTVTLN